MSKRDLELRLTMWGVKLIDNLLLDIEHYDNLNEFKKLLHTLRLKEVKRFKEVKNMTNDEFKQALDEAKKYEEVI